MVFSWGEIRGPLKQRYHEQPDTARVTRPASGLFGEGVSSTGETGRAPAEAGLRPATAGNGTHLSSGYTPAPEVCTTVVVG